MHGMSVDRSWLRWNWIVRQVWRVRERERCEASVRSRSLTLCGVWGCRTLKKKAVADKKRQQACCRPPPVCDSRQLNSRLKNFYPIRANISVELMPKIGSIECRVKGYDCVGRSFVFFLWGLTPSPHPYARSATLTKKRCENFTNFHISKFLSIFMDEGNNFY